MTNLITNFEKIFTDLLDTTSMETVILSSSGGEILKRVSKLNNNIRILAITSIGAGLFFSTSLESNKKSKEILIKSTKGLLMYYNLGESYIITVVATKDCKEGLLRVILKSFEREFFNTNRN